MNKRRACKGICVEFRVLKPAKKGRYETGQGRCHICNAWLDHKGCHLKDGSPASQNSKGMYCNCCRYRIRRNPRSAAYKTKLRTGSENQELDSEGVDLDHFNKQRATMLKKIASMIPRKQTEYSESSFEESLKQNKLSKSEIREEFNADINEILDFIYADTPNKLSMVAEFEWLKVQMGHVPTAHDIEEYSRFSAEQYEKEFESLGHLLERLGYDPWYRDTE